MSHRQRDTHEAVFEKPAAAGTTGTFGDEETTYEEYLTVTCRAVSPSELGNFVRLESGQDVIADRTLRVADPGAVDVQAGHRVTLTPIGSGSGETYQVQQVRSEHGRTVSPDVYAIDIARL